MLSRKNFFQNCNLNPNTFKRNLIKTKKVFENFKSDFEVKIPLLQSYDKNYNLDFSFDKIKKFSKYKNIIIFGMGGSALGSKCIYYFFKKKIKKKIFFFDDLDSNLHLEFKKIKDLKKSCFIVVSKSGNTLETITNLDIIFSKSLFNNKLVIITELKDNSLTKLTSKYNVDIIEHKNYIGGRYSVLSEVGMFPAALMNLNISKFKNLKKLISNKKFVSSLLNSVAFIYTYNQLKINNSVILNYDSRLHDLCLWYQQLVGESLGKRGKGIMPIVSTCPKDHHSLLQLYLDGPKDKFFTFLSTEKKILNKIDSVLYAQCQATKNIFTRKKIPFRHFTIKDNDENELGSFFTFFVLETILLAKLLNINPYDQPAVEQVKIETKKFLR